MKGEAGGAVCENKDDRKRDRIFKKEKTSGLHTLKEMSRCIVFSTKAGFFF